MSDKVILSIEESNDNVLHPNRTLFFEVGCQRFKLQYENDYDHVAWYRKMLSIALVKAGVPEDQIVLRGDSVVKAG